MKKAEHTDLYTEPTFINEACVLMDELVKYSPIEIEGLMKVNSVLAEQNFFRHLNWEKKHSLSNAKQALLAYNGAVFQGISPDDLNNEQLFFANNHLRILSGLYGVLRPLDLIQPYRLEMGQKFNNPAGRSLYVFWKGKLTEYFSEELKRQCDNTVIDLASKEYSSAVDFCKINAKVITPVFKDYKRGEYKVITIYAKRARGLMSRYIIENKIRDAQNLKEFDIENYCFNEYLSSDTEWVFTR